MRPPPTGREARGGDEPCWLRCVGRSPSCAARTGGSRLPQHRGYPPTARLWARAAGYPEAVGLAIAAINIVTKDVPASWAPRALGMLPAERLVIDPDCGLRHLPAAVARAKLHAMATATEEVRAELSDSPASKPVPDDPNTEEPHDPAG